MARRRGREYFASCIQDSLTKFAGHCPGALEGIDVGFDEVPSLTTWYEAVPLATAVAAKSGEHAQIVLYRRPIEHRCNSRTDLADLIHRTILQQLCDLTGLTPADLDPTLPD